MRLWSVIDMTTDQLSPQIHEAIQHFCADGDKLASDGQYEAAITEYNRAWEIIPEPKNHWNAATWVLAAIGDAAFLGGYNTSAREAFDFAMTCPSAVGNPFLHLRRGQLLFDLDDQQDAAADELLRAYMGGGAELFAAEDGRYLAFLKTRATLD